MRKILMVLHWLMMLLIFILIGLIYMADLPKGEQRSALLLCISRSA
ncbi:MAG: hypothetical protein ACREX4_01050 [Gammaproteobacteria bacterium]